MTREMAFGLTAFLLGATALTPGTSLATEPATERFQLERSGDRFVRLDRQTGAMSLCDEQNGNLVCRMAADERAAYDAELDRLSSRVTALEKTVAQNGGASKLPSDAEVERSIGIMERMMRSVMGMVKELQNDPSEDKPLPQKT
jgi:hypothetical protein